MILIHLLNHLRAQHQQGRDFLGLLLLQSRAEDRGQAYRIQVVDFHAERPPPFEGEHG